MTAEEIKVPRQAGAYVRRARDEQGLTRRELAARAGVSERLLASLELGDATGIRLDKLLSVLRSLNLSLWVHGEVSARSATSHVASSVAHPDTNLAGQDRQADARSDSAREELRAPHVRTEFDKHPGMSGGLDDYDRLFSAIVHDAMTNGERGSDGCS